MRASQYIGRHSWPSRIAARGRESIFVELNIPSICIARATFLGVIASPKGEAIQSGQHVKAGLLPRLRGDRFAPRNDDSAGWVPFPRLAFRSARRG
jgi:hypothetical protein